MTEPSDSEPGEQLQEPTRELEGADAERYERIKLRVSLSNIAISIVLPVVFLFSGWSEGLRDVIEDWTGVAALVVLIYVLIAAAASEAITFPLDYYSGLMVERRFKLSRASRKQWFIDWAKGQALQLVFVLAAV